ncbi:hypothetical protein AVEN_246560-1 [Araneus ventricosus]|uniref:Helitron helicase-like domain-containing protein n=1 Tax=Araneus ventricosus TaxID=182803 RepID=A0A4Y2DCJ1_ARAVE|nr:hypothetical protein AVEN_246560-1 [Araneus ventricosus]
MYAKIDVERLLFIRLNQKKLRVDEYIHLKDAITNHSDPANHGKLVILPSTCTGCPRNMHEYAQDATFVMVESHHYSPHTLSIQISKRWHKMANQKLIDMIWLQGSFGKS